MQQFRYIVERASQTINVEDSLVPDHGSLLLKTSNDINGIAALSPWCEYACRSLTELVCDNQGDSWSQAIAADQREAVSKIIGITRLVLVRVVASRQIEAAYYNLWIVRPLNSCSFSHEKDRTKLNSFRFFAVSTADAKMDPRRAEGTLTACTPMAPSRELYYYGTASDYFEY